MYSNPSLFVIELVLNEVICFRFAVRSFWYISLFFSARCSRLLVFSFIILGCGFVDEGIAVCGCVILLFGSRRAIELCCRYLSGIGLLMMIGRYLGRASSFWFCRWDRLLIFLISWVWAWLWCMPMSLWLWALFLYTQLPGVTPKELSRYSPLRKTDECLLLLENQMPE